MGGMHKQTFPSMTETLHLPQMLTDLELEKRKSLVCDLDLWQTGLNEDDPRLRLLP